MVIYFVAALAALGFLGFLLYLLVQPKAGE